MHFKGQITWPSAVLHFFHYQEVYSLWKKNQQQQKNKTHTPSNGIYLKLVHNYL